MSEIPEDIREAAANALNIAEDMTGTLFSDRVEVIAKAILGERKRCSDVARRVGSDLRNGDKIRHVAAIIATKIYHHSPSTPNQAEAGKP